MVTKAFADDLYLAINNYCKANFKCTIDDILRIVIGFHGVTIYKDNNQYGTEVSYTTLYHKYL